MQEKFKFSGQAEIHHLNPRKEGPEEDKQLAVDVKFKATAPSSVLAYFDEGLDGLLFTERGEVSNPMIGSIHFRHELHNYRLEMGGNTYSGVTIKKFVLEATKGKRVSLTFQASFYPSSAQLAQMAQSLQTEIDIELGPMNGELAISFNPFNNPEAHDAMRAMKNALAQNNGSISIENGQGETVFQMKA